MLSGLNGCGSKTSGEEDGAALICMYLQSQLTSVRSSQCRTQTDSISILLSAVQGYLGLNLKSFKSQKTRVT